MGPKDSEEPVHRSITLHWQSFLLVTLSVLQGQRPLSHVLQADGSGSGRGQKPAYLAPSLGNHSTSILNLFHQSQEDPVGRRCDGWVEPSGRQAFQSQTKQSKAAKCSKTHTVRHPSLQAYGRLRQESAGAGRLTWRVAPYRSSSARGSQSSPYTSWLTPHLRPAASSHEPARSSVCPAREGSPGGSSSWLGGKMYAFLTEDIEERENR